MVSHLWPFLWDSRRRVLLALACLLLAKGAVIAIPFLLKFLVDALERSVEASDDAATDAVVAALRRQTGIDAGRDPEGWRRRLER